LKADIPVDDDLLQQRPVSERVNSLPAGVVVSTLLMQKQFDMARV